MNLEEKVTFPLDKKTKKLIMYKWHKRILFISTIITILAIIITIMMTDLFSKRDLMIELIGLKQYEEINKYIVALLLLPFVFVVLRMVNSAKFSATGAVASKDQFSYVNDIVMHYSKMAGLKKFIWSQL